MSDYKKILCEASLGRFYQQLVGKDENEGKAIAILRNSCATNLLVVDEVLDSSLDEEGINMAMNLFRSFKDSNIFVISHRETIQDSRFDKIIKVKKERQFSVIEDE